MPTTLMKMSLHNWPDGTPDYTTHHVMKDYIQDITTNFGVHQHIRYQTNVLEIKKIGDAWNVRSKTRKCSNAAATHALTPRDERFDALIVATGHYHHPRVPDIPGLRSLKQSHPQWISHSKGYRGADHLTGKNILLIGSSASAIDIARDAVLKASKVYHSGRGGQFDVPQSFFPAGTIHIGEVIDIEHKEDNTPHELPAKFRLADGSTICDIDAIILCTGYLISLPYLADYHNDDMPVDQASENVLVTNGLMYHNLHKDIFYIPDPSLIFVGVPYFSANFSLFDFQAQIVAAVLAGLAELPTKAEMRREYNEKLAEKGAGKQFHSLKGVEVDYVNELLAWVNPQLQGHGKEPIKGHTPEWHAAKDAMYAAFKEAFGLQGVPQAPIVDGPQLLQCAA